MSRKHNAVRNNEVEVEANVVETNAMIEQEANGVEVETTESVAIATATATDSLPSIETLGTAEELITKFGSKSAAIRALAQMGYKTGPIAKGLNIIYQHARNVLNQPLKRVIKAEREAAKAPTTHVTE